MDWKKVETKPRPHYGMQVLCAWKLGAKQSSWMFDVLTHWPDGTWTDDADDEVPELELPQLWKAIDQPVDA